MTFFSGEGYNSGCGVEYTIPTIMGSFPFAHYTRINIMNDIFKKFLPIAFMDPDDECENCNAQGGGDCAACEDW